MRGQEAAAAAKTGGALKRAQADEALSDLRKTAICRCLDGKCERPASTASTQCSGCPRRLHVATCGGFGSARAAAGVLKCFYCRALDMAPDQVPTYASPLSECKDRRDPIHLRFRSHRSILNTQLYKVTKRQRDLTRRWSPCSSSYPWARRGRQPRPRPIISSSRILRCSRV